MARQAAPPRAGSRLAARVRRLSGSRRAHVLTSDAVVLVALSVLSAVLAAAGHRWPTLFPVSTQSLVILVGGFLLRLRSLVLLYGVVAAAILYSVVAAPRATVGGVLVDAVTAIIILLLARVRSRLGVQGTLGESMLVDLRDRLRQHGEMPALPPGWQAEVVLRPAGGASFSGDFLVSTRSTDGRTLEVALVDVSGKGVAAGTRSLLLSGAFGGLLGSMAPPEFLPAANEYLLRQRWPEGFATAVHLVIDLESGRYVVTTAGHPPAAQFVAGSGRWRLHETTEGPLLGLLEGAQFHGEPGYLARGDALLLYTDGLVEVPGRDLEFGIDRLLGEAERLVTRGFRNGARKLIDAVAMGESDDRALVLIWRD